METLFTTMYVKNKNTNSIQKSQKLLTQLPALLKQLGITSIVDCGCGDFWLNKTDLSGIQYTGLDIVKPLIEENQKLYTTDTIRFAVANVCMDPPFDADLWIARDVLCLWTIQDCVSFFEKFLESSAKYIALTSIEVQENPQEDVLGIWKRQNVRIEPFNLPTPLFTLDDGMQWFCSKKLLIYTRDDIDEWFDTINHYHYTDHPSKTQRNANLQGNISLRDYQFPL